MTLVQSVSQKRRVVQEDVTRSRFHGLPDTTLLESGALPIAEIAELAMREGQCTNPLYRVHRWFARRLGSQFRSILTGLSLDADEANRFWDTFLGEVPLDGAVALDPFSPAPRFPGTPNCGMMAAERRTDGKAEVRKRAWSILFQA